LEGRESQLGAQHPDTLTSVNNLAVLWEKQGKLEEAGMRSLGWGWPSRQNCQGKACGQDEKLVNFLVSKTGGILGIGM
jgi:hypothetical protein